MRVGETGRSSTQDLVLLLQQPDPFTRTSGASARVSGARPVLKNYASDLPDPRARIVLVSQCDVVVAEHPTASDAIGGTKMNSKIRTRVAGAAILAAALLGLGATGASASGVPPQHRSVPIETTVAGVGDVDDYFYQTYVSQALCRSIASDLRQAHYTITIDCTRLQGSYILSAFKVSVGG
jgi:hypothetical protein